MGIRLLDQKLRGFGDPEALLTGPETAKFLSGAYPAGREL